MTDIRNLCVFCGSSDGIRPDYKESAKRLGKLCVEKNISLIYGAGDIGIMGVLARSVMDNGGTVTGIIPEKINAMVPGLDLTTKIVTDTMHERKQKMYDLADAFVALPGGIGTIEELFEVYTWRQLGYHLKPVGVLNICGFFDPVREMLEHMVSEGFLKRNYIDMLVFSDDPEDLLNLLARQNAEYVPKI